jgi:hypothetical protein
VVQKDTQVELAKLDVRLCAEVALRKREQELRDQNLVLQAKEYERRLETLNNENGRILAAGAKSVDREYFESRINAVIDRVLVAEKKLTEMGGRTGGLALAKSDILSVLPILISMIALAVAMYLTFRK